MGLPVEDWATVAENVKELATQAHPQSEDLASGFAMSRFLTLLEEDSDLAIRVRTCRSAPKTLNEAVQEATRLECINHAVHKRSVHVSAPINLDKGLSLADLAKSIQMLAEGIAGLKASQEQNFATMKNSLSEHENRLLQLESTNTGRAPQKTRLFQVWTALRCMIQAITIWNILVKLWGGYAYIRTK